MTDVKQAVILTFDRLSLSLLGCYGHSLISTPHFDRLATESVVYDQHYAENIDDAASAHAWATGCFHFSRTDRQQQSLPNVAEILSQSGVQTTLISERGAHTPVINCQNEIQVAGRIGPAAEPAETPFAQLVSRAIEVLAEWQPNPSAHRLLWLHSQGVPLPWSPPRQFARDVMSRCEPVEEADDEDEMTDPLASDEGELQIEELPDESFDAYVTALVEAAVDVSAATELLIDEWAVARFALAGYVELLDWSFGRLLSSMTDCDSTLFIVTAAQGVEAGERLMMSLPPAALPEEITHTPLFLQSPGIEPGTRRQDLVQTVDLVPTLLDWFPIDSQNHRCEGRSLLPSATQSDAPPREAIYMGDGTAHRAIRTRERSLIQCITPTPLPPGEGPLPSRRRRSRVRAGSLKDAADDAGNEAPQLFVKPDDVWEVHDVAGQSPAEVDQLTATLDQFVSQIK